MSSFQEKKAAAQAAAVPFKDVPVSLDAGFSAKRDALIERINAPQDDQRLAQADPTESLKQELEELLEQENDSLVTLRFYKVPGDEWANLTATHPARQSALIDMKYGYNMHAVCRASAVSNGRVVEGESELTQTEAEWSELWVLLAGSDFANVCDAIFLLNEYEPNNRIERLKKALAGTPASEENSN